MLYVCYRVPFPPDKGERIRCFHQICTLAEHRPLHLVCPARVQPSADTLDALHRRCASVRIASDSSSAARLRSLGHCLRGRARACGAHDSAALRHAVHSALAQYSVDTVIASSVFVARALSGVRGVRKVLDLVDVYSAVLDDQAARMRSPLRQLAQYDARRTRTFERSVLAEFDEIVVSSLRDAALCRDVLGAAHVHIVGNGVDGHFFQPAVSSPSLHETDFVFTGTMDYAPNVDAVIHFARDILPRVHRTCPQATFTIVGRQPVASVRRLRREPGVRVTGAVDDVRPFLHRATAAVAPMRYGQGIQNKVLEAMACGLAVVGSPRALSGLQETGALAYRCAADPDTFASELVRLATDPDWRVRCADAARAYVLQHHDWNDCGERLLDAASLS